MSLSGMLRASCILLSALLATACGSARPVAPDDQGVTFIVVRHAEKANDDPENPSLSTAGQARAAQLAQQLQGEPVTAIYATEFRRTGQTAQPTAAAHRIPVSAYYARGPADEIAAQWKRQHTRGTVLVVGHSNTVPELVAALCGCATQPMDDTEYDRLSIVRIDASGKATLDMRTYGPPSP